MTNSKKTPTFKTQRAAKIAFGKAERAWEAARSARIDAHHKAVAGGYGETYDAEVAPFKETENATYDAAKAIYDAAASQGFYCHSYEFGYNATRELIAQNID